MSFSVRMILYALSRIWLRRKRFCHNWQIIKRDIEQNMNRIFYYGAVYITWISYLRFEL